jgi:hypothetical protein
VAAVACLVLAIAVVAALLVLRSRDVDVRVADFETRDFSVWDHGPNVLPDPGATVVRDTEMAAEGAASARATIPAGPGNKYARTLWGGFAGEPEALALGEGAEFTYGMALYLPAGFHEQMQGYFVPVRWDNFGADQVSRGGLAMYGDGSVQLFREREGVEEQVNLLGERTFRLTEQEWHWIEVRQRLSTEDGTARNELRVDDELIGESETANYYGEPVTAIRYGIVAIADGRQTEPLSVLYDRAFLGSR